MPLLIFSFLLLFSLFHLGFEALIEFVRRYKTALFSLLLLGVACISLLIAAIEPATTNYQPPTEYNKQQTIQLPPKNASELVSTWDKIRSIQPNNPQLQQNPISID